MNKERKKYFANLNMQNYTDNKKFWNTVKPLFSNYNGGSWKITLVKDNEIISNDEEVAKVFNEYFIESINSLDIAINKALLSTTEDFTDPVAIALKKFEIHPSILISKRKSL